MCQCFFLTQIFLFKLKLKAESTEWTWTWSACAYNPPLLDEFAGDGPHAGAREHVSVEHTQFQLEVGLLQLPDHLVDKLNVALAVADEGIKQLGYTWNQVTFI